MDISRHTVGSELSLHHQSVLHCSARTAGVRLTYGMTQHAARQLSDSGVGLLFFTEHSSHASCRQVVPWCLCVRLTRHSSCLNSAHIFQAAIGAFTGKGQQLRNARAGRCGGRHHSCEWELPDERGQAGCCGCSTCAPHMCAAARPCLTTGLTTGLTLSVFSARGLALQPPGLLGCCACGTPTLGERRLWVEAIDQQPLLLTGECMSGQCRLLADLPLRWGSQLARRVCGAASWGHAAHPAGSPTARGAVPGAARAAASRGGCTGWACC